MPLAWRREYVGIFRLKTRRKKLQIYFIDNEHYFNRGGVYGFCRTTVNAMPISARPSSQQ